MKPDYLNDDESEKLPPGFSTLKNENPFSVPDHYFDSLADIIQQKIQSLPDFEQVSTQNPFRVPPGYFETLPGAIQQRIADEKNKKAVFTEWISIAFRPKLSLALATVIILITVGIIYVNHQSGRGASDNIISCEEMKNSSYMSDIDEDTFIDVLEQQNKTNNLKEDNSFEQYLIDNNIDISQLESRL